MPRTIHRIVRRGLLAAGGTLLAGAVTGKYAWRHASGPARAAAPQAPLAQSAGPLTGRPPVPLPALRFIGGDGAAWSLDDYAGKGIVLNFWATWCVPCVSEMPALDALSRSLAGQGIVVLAVSEDHGGAAVVRPFYAAHGIASLPVLLDPESEAMSTLGLAGVPTTLLVDAHGREVRRIEGPQPWDAPEAIAAIKHLIG